LRKTLDTTNNLLIAKEIAARHARLAWTGECWTATPCIAEPLTLSPGDEYFARATVCRIIEQMGEQVADRVGLDKMMGPTD
jgi:hypothetical protein